jgi:S-adenosylmethionine:tRNA ribosyltransferase-isomerase
MSRSHTLSKQAFVDYSLPSERIAQQPIGLANERSNSNLLHLKLNSNEYLIEDRHVFDFANLLRADDLVIFNQSKVVPVRFVFNKSESNSEIEVLLVRRLEQKSIFETWEALARPMKRLKAGDKLQISKSLLATMLGRSEDKRKIIIELSISDDEFTSIEKAIEHQGSMPIPVYIRHGRSMESDRELYQTVYAKDSGSIAAPTAGLHFNDQSFNDFKARGIEFHFITHHVGLASFQSVNVDDYRDYQMPSESYLVSTEVGKIINKAKTLGRRIVAVGTTTARALESWARSNHITDQLIETDLFIYPGFEFKIVNCLFTNFHQPRTTHMLLVSALAGADALSAAYQHALQRDYRFLSYGDAMFVDIN